MFFLTSRADGIFWPDQVLKDGVACLGVLAVLLLLVLWAGGLGLQQLPWTRPAGEPIRVSLLQGNIPQAEKWLREMREPSVQLYLEMTGSVPDSRIVVWPETAVPAFDSDVESTLLAPLHRLLQEQRRDVLLGIVQVGTTPPTTMPC